MNKSVREELRLMAYGSYAFSRRSESYDKEEADLFVEGALKAYDLLLEKYKLVPKSSLDHAQSDQKTLDN